MTQTIHILLSLLLLVGITTCQRTRPQSPSQRNGIPATTTEQQAVIDLVELNQKMAAEADKALIRYVQNHPDGTYTQQRAGYWMHYVTHQYDNDGDGLEEGDKCMVHLVTRTLDRELLTDSEQEIILGHDELPTAVYLTIKQMHHGEQVELLCPWYCAYGANGNELVGAYQNIIYEIELR